MAFCVLGNEYKANVDGYETFKLKLKNKLYKKFKRLLNKMRLNETQISFFKFDATINYLQSEYDCPLVFTHNKYIVNKNNHIRIFSPFGTLIEDIKYVCCYLTNFSIIYSVYDESENSNIYRLNLKTLKSKELFNSPGVILYASDDILIVASNKIIHVIKDDHTVCIHTDRKFPDCTGRYMIKTSRKNEPILYDFYEEKYYRISNIIDRPEVKYLRESIGNKELSTCIYSIPIEAGVYATLTSLGHLTISSKTQFYDIHKYLYQYFNKYTVRLVRNLILCDVRDKVMVFKYKDDKLLFKLMGYHEIVEVSDEYFFMVQNKLLHKVYFKEFSSFQ